MFAIDNSAGVRATNLLHVMRDVFLFANRALLMSMNPVTMFVAMALQAIGDPIIDFVSKFWVLAPLFYVVGLQDAAPFAAFLAGIIVPTNNGIAPFPVFCSALLYVSFSCAPCLTPLIVRLLIALFHGVMVDGFSLVGGQVRLSAFRYIFFTKRTRVGAISTTVGLNRTFRLKNFLAIQTSLDHVVSRINGFIVAGNYTTI